MRTTILAATLLNLAACGTKSTPSASETASLTSASIYARFAAVPLAERTAYFNQIGAFTPEQWATYLTAHATETLHVDGMTIRPQATSGQRFTHLRDVWTALGRDPASITVGDIQIMELLYAAPKKAASALQLTMLIPGDQDIQDNFCSAFPSTGTNMHMTMKTWADLPPTAVMGKYTGMGGIISKAPVDIDMNTFANVQTATSATLWKPDNPADPTGLMIKIEQGPNGYDDQSEPAVTTKSSATPEQYEAICSALNRYGKSPAWQNILANGLTQLDLNSPRPIPGYSGGRTR